MEVNNVPLNKVKLAAAKWKQVRDENGPESFKTNSAISGIEQMAEQRNNRITNRVAFVKPGTQLQGYSNDQLYNQMPVDNPNKVRDAVEYSSRGRQSSSFNNAPNTQQQIESLRSSLGNATGNQQGNTGNVNAQPVNNPVQNKVNPSTSTGNNVQPKQQYNPNFEVKTGTLGNNALSPIERPKSKGEAPSEPISRKSEYPNTKPEVEFNQPPSRKAMTDKDVKNSKISQYKADQVTQLHNDAGFQNKLVDEKFKRQLRDIQGTAESTQKISPLRKMFPTFMGAGKEVAPEISQVQRNRIKDYQGDLNQRQLSEMQIKPTQPQVQEKAQTSSGAKAEQPKVNTQGAKAEVQGQKGIGDAAKDIYNTNQQAMESTFGKGGKVRNSLNTYMHSPQKEGIGHSIQNIVRGGMKEGNVLDKGLNFVAKHGLKTGLIGAGLTVGAGLGLGAYKATKAINNNPSGFLAAGTGALAVGGPILSGFLRSKGNEAMSEGLDQSINAANKIGGKGKGFLNGMFKTASEENNVNIETMLPEGMVPLEESFSFKKTASEMPMISNELQLLEYMGKLPVETQDKLQRALLSMQMTKGGKNAKNLAIGTALSIGGGVVSNFATDIVRKGTGVTNRPIVVVANNKRTADKITSKIASLETPLIDSAKLVTGANSPITKALAKMTMFSAKHPTLTPLLAGAGAVMVAPPLIDQAVRGLSNSYHYMNNAYYGLGGSYGYGGGGGYYGY